MNRDERRNRARTMAAFRLAYCRDVPRQRRHPVAQAPRRHPRPPRAPRHRVPVRARAGSRPPPGALHRRRRPARGILVADSTDLSPPARRVDAHCAKPALSLALWTERRRRLRPCAFPDLLRRVQRSRRGRAPRGATVVAGAPHRREQCDRGPDGCVSRPVSTVADPDLDGGPRSTSRSSKCRRCSSSESGSCFSFSPTSPPSGSMRRTA